MLDDVEVRERLTVTAKEVAQPMRFGRCRGADDKDSTMLVLDERDAP
jgi:hypothetical protein